MKFFKSTGVGIGLGSLLFWIFLFIASTNDKNEKNKIKELLNIEQSAEQSEVIDKKIEALKEKVLDTGKTLEETMQEAAETLSDSINKAFSKVDKKVDYIQEVNEVSDKIVADLEDNKKEEPELEIKKPDSDETTFTPL